jgi:hypothetical protein
VTLPELPANLTGAGIQAYLVWKLLGPPAGAVGSTLANLVDQTAENVGRVFKNAAGKVGPDLNRPGSVPLRALGKLIDEAALSEEPIVVEYLGGVLASSRTHDGRDDRGIAWSSLIGRLSRDQLRLHYLLYETARRAMQDEDEINLGVNTDRATVRMFLSFQDFIDHMALGPGDVSNWHAHFSEAFLGLHREGLVGSEYGYGGVDHLRTEFPEVTETGAIWEMSVAGIKLFLWGMGYGTKPVQAFGDRELSWELAEPIEPLSRSGAIKTLTAAAVAQRHLEDVQVNEGAKVQNDESGPDLDPV